MRECLLNDGTLDGVQIFKPETVKLMTSVQSPEGVTARRGLGWDIDSPYNGPRGKIFPLGSYGHTGLDGDIDMDRAIFAELPDFSFEPESSG